MAPQLLFASNVEVDQHRSPNGLVENCYRNSAIPGDVRSPEAKKADAKQEAKLCALDFYDSKLALCPKTWSTSAGTIVHSLEGRPEDTKTYEAKVCPLGKDNQAKSIAKFKTTMNAHSTSGTFAPSSAIYYQLSRFLETSVTAPVAVMRSMDRKAHYDRITNAPKHPQSAMNAAAWDLLKRAEVTPSAYSPVRELFLPDLSQIYGVILKDKGERYGLEVNGIRSAWGDAQNFDFQKTMPFLALKSPKDLASAMADGRAQADAKIRAATGNPDSLQMLFWMNEISEIALMDYVMGQQDRIGNIDYLWVWYTTDSNGVLQSLPDSSKLTRSKMDQIPKPDAIKDQNALLVQRTWIGDNDAGGRPQYTNFTKRTKMLENLRHMSPRTYRRLLALVNDFKSQGEMYQHLSTDFFLDDAQMKMIVLNAEQAAAILQNSCKAGQIRFDLLIDLKPGTLAPSGREVPVSEVGCS